MSDEGNEVKRGYIVRSGHEVMIGSIGLGGTRRRGQEKMRGLQDEGIRRGYYQKMRDWKEENI